MYFPDNLVEYARVSFAICPDFSEKSTKKKKKREN
jgi:hypothetical protein